MSYFYAESSSRADQVDVLDCGLNGIPPPDRALHEQCSKFPMLSITPYTGLLYLAALHAL